MWKVEPIFIVYNFPCLYEQYLFNLSSLLTLFLLLSIIINVARAFVLVEAYS